MFIYMAYHNTTKQKLSTGPLSTSVKRTDGKFDLFHQGSGFAEAGSGASESHKNLVGAIPYVYKCGVRLRGPRSYSGVWAASSASLPPSKFIDLLELETHRAVRANRCESREDFWFPMFIYMAYPNTNKQKCPLVPFLRRSNAQTGNLTFSTRVRVLPKRGSGASESHENLDCADRKSVV